MHTFYAAMLAENQCLETNTILKTLFGVTFLLAHLSSIPIVPFIKCSSLTTPSNS